MNKLRSLIAGVFIVCLVALTPAHPQEIKASGINFGGNNLLTESSGNGAPSPSCTGLAKYTQLDNSTAPYWVCSNGTFVHLSSGSSFSLNPNTAIATNGSGALSNLPEIGTSTSGGNTTIAWAEDTNNGIFDPRRPINGHGGVNGGINNAAAWQDVFNEAACWSITQWNPSQGSATVMMPPGDWQIGTAAAPTLMGGPGVIYVGSPGGTGFSPISLGGTQFLATYAHVPVVSLVDPFYVPCAGDVAVNVSSIAITSNVATVTAVNSFTVGTIVSFSGVTAGALWFLNQQNTAYAITSANSTSFTFNVTYANVSATSQSGAVAQQVHVDSNNGGSVSNVTVNGCVERSCSTVPGDPNNAGETANETGIFIGWTHTSNIGPLSANYTHGEGIVISGLDVIAQGPFMTQSTASYWFNPDAGDTNAATGIHAQVDLSSGDGRFFHIETYGIFSDPIPAEIGHQCEVLLGGGNTMVDDMFINIGQMGVCTVGSGERISHFRVDGVRGPSLYDAGFSNTWDTGFVDGYCLSSVFKFHPTYDPAGTGTCDGIYPVGAGISTFSNITMQRNFFDGETFEGSGDIIQSPDGTKVTNVIADSTQAEPAYDNSYDSVGGGNVGQNMMMLPQDAAVSNGKGVVLTGATPNVQGHRHVNMHNGSATNITDLTNATLQTDYKIVLDSTNDVLVSIANGGKFSTCDGYNIVGPALVDFTAVQTKVSYAGGNVFLETCPSVNKNYWQVNTPGNTLPATNALSSLDVFGNSAVHATAALPNGAFSQAGAASIYTYNWVTVVYVAGGKQTNTPQSTQQTPLATQTGSNNIFYHQSIPLDWTRYKIILQSTTDPSFTPGTYYDVTAPNAAPQPAIADINLPLTVLSPLNATVLLTTNYAVNMTGTFTFDPSNIPAHSTTPCMPGQVKLDVTNGYEYYCVSEDTWKRATLTFSTF